MSTVPFTFKDCLRLRSSSHLEKLGKYPLESVNFRIAHQQPLKNNALEVIVDTNKKAKRHIIQISFVHGIKCDSITKAHKLLNASPCCPHQSFYSAIVINLYTTFELRIFSPRCVEYLYGFCGIIFRLFSIKFFHKDFSKIFS